MAGNAHRNRPRSKPCPAGCIYCQLRASEGKRLGRFKNKTGNRHNDSSKKRGRRNKTANVSGR